MTPAAVVVWMVVCTAGAGPDVLHGVAAPRLVVTLTDEEAVQSGRGALKRWGTFPWYDSDTDGVRRIEIREPWKAPQASFSLEPLAWLALALLLAALIAGLIWAFRNRRRRSEEVAGDDASEIDDDQRRSEALPAAAARKRADLLEEARRLYEEGRFSEAIVYLFSYQLVRLDKQQLLHLAKGKTNRQYLRELSSRVPLRGLLEQTMLVFEDAFFGNYTIDRGQFESCWSRLDEFESLAAEAAA